MPVNPRCTGVSGVARALLFRVGPTHDTHPRLPEEIQMIRPRSIRVAALAVAFSAAALGVAPRHAWAQG